MKPNTLLLAIAFALALPACLASSDLQLDGAGGAEPSPLTDCQKASLTCEEDPACGAFLGCIEQRGEEGCGARPALYAAALEACPNGFEVTRPTKR